jgi:hypothetical protein
LVDRYFFFAAFFAGAFLAAAFFAGAFFAAFLVAIFSYSPLLVIWNIPAIHLLQLKNV